LFKKGSAETMLDLLTLQDDIASAVDRVSAGVLVPVMPALAGVAEESYDACRIRQ
jgi:hypothetical protein